MELFQYNRLVFGITSAPAVWQRNIDQVLEGTSATNCILNDMIVTGKNDEEHLANDVLRRLQVHGVRADKAKCEFFKEKTAFCGHDIDSHGLHTSPEKVEAVSKAPRPRNVAEVRSTINVAAVRASQVLQQILAQSVNSGTPLESVVREQPSMEMDATMRNSISQCERNDHLRASVNTL